MSEIMYEEGYNFIYNIDFSKKCIGMMQEMYKDYGENFKCFFFFLSIFESFIKFISLSHGCQKYVVRK